MAVFSLGLATLNPAATLRSLYFHPKVSSIPGLKHIECLTPMALGSPIFSPQRMQLQKIIVFAAWESEEAIEEFLASTSLGRSLAKGWHLRMTFLRKWGDVKAFAWLPGLAGESDPLEPVAAFTLARMRLLEVPRFIRWGRPVEALVRDNPNTTMSFAGIRYPNSVATFSIWNTQQDMLDMVRGKTHMEDPRRHIEAMKERERRNFHYEFTTLRFRPLSEHGTWNGIDRYIPASKPLRCWK